MSLELEVYKAFEEQMTGDYRSLQHSGCNSQVDHRMSCCQVNGCSKIFTLHASMQCLEQMLTPVTCMTVLEFCSCNQQTIGKAWNDEHVTQSCMAAQTN